MEENMSDVSKYNKSTVSDDLNEAIIAVLIALGDLEFNHQVDLIRIDQDLEDKETKEALWNSANISHQQNLQPFVTILSGLKMQQHRQSFKY
jgi:hypothetical protein